MKNAAVSLKTTRRKLEEITSFMLVTQKNQISFFLYFSSFGQL